MKILRTLKAESWNAFLQSIPEATIFQTPEMREVYASTKNYEPIVLACEDEGGIRDLVLACIIREGGGFKGSFSSRAIVVGGPITRHGDFRPILKSLDDTLRRKALYVQVRNLRDMSASRQSFEELGYSCEEHLNFVHDLTKPLSEIWAGFSESRQKGIRKAEERGVKVREGEDRADVDAFYELVSGTYGSVGVPLADKSLFESAWRVLKPKGMIRLALAVKDEDVLAGRMMLACRRILHDWYAGSTDAGRKLNANELLVWLAMQWGSANGYRLFDFGGAGRPDEEYGPGEFKRRFGGAQTNYGRFQKVYHPLKYAAARKGYEVLRKLG